MGRNLQPYKDELARSEQRLRLLLSSGEGSVDDVALARGEYDLLNYQITVYPQAVLSNYDGAAPDRETGYSGAKLWRLDGQRYAYRQIMPHLVDENGERMFRQRLAEYNDLAINTILQLPYKPPTRVEDTVSGVVYLVRPNGDLLKKAAPIIASELLYWFNHHPMSPDFLKKSAKDGYFQFLVERPDIRTLFRLIDEVPMDVTPYYDPTIIVKPPIEQAIIEMAIAFVPVVGTLVAAYEAYQGKDLFGNSLDPLDRSILASSVLFAAAGRFIRNGRAVYSETRLVRLAGREAADWERAISAAGRIDADTMRVIGRAEEVVRTQKKLAPALAREAAAALPDVANPRGLLQSAIDKEISATFRELRESHPIMETLDDFAIRRVLEKGPNVDHIKGQLLEELIESRLLPWLLERNGTAALGFQFTGQKLVYIPGHMIRDAFGRQITDGILGMWHDGELVIGAIFEAKAGRYAARELSFAGGSISKLTKDQRAELRAMSRDIYNTEKAWVERAGQKYVKTLEDVEKEVIQSERGGQARRDFERLSEDVYGVPAFVYIGDMPHAVPVRISPTRTRFFGLIPKDAGRKTIERQLTQGGFSFEILGVNLTSKQLKTAAEKLSPIAEKMLGGTP